MTDPFGFDDMKKFRTKVGENHEAEIRKQDGYEDLERYSNLERANAEAARQAYEVEPEHYE